MTILRDLILLSRPRHWAKNAFVLMPVPFGVAAGADIDVLRFLTGLVGFGLVSSAVYAFNDVRDAAQDRLHPDKRDRPIASGRIGPGLAIGWSCLLLAGSLIAAYAAAGGSALAIVIAYAVINMIYSLGAKDLALIDVFLLSAGFVLRVLFGCALIAVPPSNWLLLCSSTLALFLSLAKRRSDLARGLGSEQRPSLAGYSLGFLDLAIGISAGMTLLGYALYCIEAEVLVPGREFASIPFVLFGVLDYLRVALVTDRAGSPVEMILSSPSLQASGLGWAVATGWSLGLF